MNGKALSVPLFVAVVVVFMSCENAGTNGPGKTVEITDVGWRFENTDRAFYDPQSNYSARAYFSIIVNDDIVEEDVESMVISANGITWTYESDEIDIGTDNDFDVILVHGSAGGDTIPLTGWEFTVTLTNGESATVTRDYAPPNASTPNQATAYTEDYTGSTSGMVSMLARGTISSATFDGTDLVVEFSVNDSRVANAWLWAYTASGKYIGSTSPVASWDATETVDTDILTPPFSDDGSTNTMSIQQTEFDVSSDVYGWDDIGSVVLLLTDGSQWTGDYDFDFRSRTALYDVTTP